MSGRVSLLAVGLLLVLAFSLVTTSYLKQRDALVQARAQLGEARGMQVRRWTQPPHAVHRLITWSKLLVCLSGSAMRRERPQQPKLRCTITALMSCLPLLPPCLVTHAPARSLASQPGKASVCRRSRHEVSASTPCLQRFFFLGPAAPSHRRVLRSSASTSLCLWLAMSLSAQLCRPRALLHNSPLPLR